MKTAPGASKATPNSDQPAGKASQEKVASVQTATGVEDAGRAEQEGGEGGEGEGAWEGEGDWEGGEGEEEWDGEEENGDDAPQMTLEELEKFAQSLEET